MDSEDESLGYDEWIESFDEEYNSEEEMDEKDEDINTFDGYRYLNDNNDLKATSSIGLDESNRHRMKSDQAMEDWNGTMNSYENISHFEHSNPYQMKYGGSLRSYLLSSLLSKQSKLYHTKPSILFQSNLIQSKVSIERKNIASSIVSSNRSYTRDPIGIEENGYVSSSGRLIECPEKDILCLVCEMLLGHENDLFELILADKGGLSSYFKLTQLAQNVCLINRDFCYSTNHTSISDMNKSEMRIGLEMSNIALKRLLESFARLGSNILHCRQYVHQSHDEYIPIPSSKQTSLSDISMKQSIVKEPIAQAKESIAKQSISIRSILVGAMIDLLAAIDSHIIIHERIMKSIDKNDYDLSSNRNNKNNSSVNQTILLLYIRCSPWIELFDTVSHLITSLDQITNSRSEHLQSVFIKRIFDCQSLCQRIQSNLHSSTQNSIGKDKKGMTLQGFTNTTHQICINTFFKEIGKDLIQFLISEKSIQAIIPIKTSLRKEKKITENKESQNQVKRMDSVAQYRNLDTEFVRLVYGDALSRAEDLNMLMRLQKHLIPVRIKWMNNTEIIKKHSKVSDTMQSSRFYIGRSYEDIIQYQDDRYNTAYDIATTAIPSIPNLKQKISFQKMHQNYRNEKENHTRPSILSNKIVDKEKKPMFGILSNRQILVSSTESIDRLRIHQNKDKDKDRDKTMKRTVNQLNLKNSKDITMDNSSMINSYNLSSFLPNPLRLRLLIYEPLHKQMQSKSIRIKRILYQKYAIDGQYLLLYHIYLFGDIQAWMAIKEYFLDVWIMKNIGKQYIHNSSILISNKFIQPEINELKQLIQNLSYYFSSELIVSSNQSIDRLPQKSIPTSKEDYQHIEDDLFTSTHHDSPYSVVATFKTSPENSNPSNIPSSSSSSISISSSSSNLFISLFDISVFYRPPISDILSLPSIDIYQNIFYYLFQLQTMKWLSDVSWKEGISGRGSGIFTPKGSSSVESSYPNQSSRVEDIHSAWLRCKLLLPLALHMSRSIHNLVFSFITDSWNEFHSKISISKDSFTSSHVTSTTATAGIGQSMNKQRNVIVSNHMAQNKIGLPAIASERWNHEEYLHRIHETIEIYRLETKILLELLLSSFESFLSCNVAYQKLSNSMESNIPDSIKEDIRIEYIRQLVSLKQSFERVEEAKQLMSSQLHLSLRLYHRSESNRNINTSSKLLPKHQIEYEIRSKLLVALGW